MYANGGAAFYDAAFADQTRGFLFGQEFFEGLVVEFLGMGGIFACKRWFSRECGLAGESWELTTPSRHSLVYSSQSGLKLLQDDGDLLADGPLPVVPGLRSGGHLGVGFLQSYELNLIMVGGVYGGVVAVRLCELADDVGPHQVPLFLCDFNYAGP